MRSVGQRSFDCPESGEKCTDPNCTAGRCCEAVRLAALENAPRDKVYNWSIYEGVRRIVRKNFKLKG
jgi:hypothetical protein